MALVWHTRTKETAAIFDESATMIFRRALLSAASFVWASSNPYSETFKKQIRDQLGTTRPLPPGPVHLQLHFTVGPGRNWLNLWKPAIDALGKILGHTPAATAWVPLDGRIVDLGLHCRVDPARGNDITITIAAKRTPG